MMAVAHWLNAKTGSRPACGGNPAAAAAADRNTRYTIIGGGAERNHRTFALGLGQFTIYNLVAKGGFMSEGTGGFLLLQKNIPNLYPEQKIWISRPEQ